MPLRRTRALPCLAPEKPESSYFRKFRTFVEEAAGAEECPRVKPE
jgi:hypothetical protein